MIWNKDGTGIKYKNYIRVDKVTETIQIWVFLGFDDTWKAQFTALLAGIFNINYGVGLQAGQSGTLDVAKNIPVNMRSKLFKKEFEATYWCPDCKPYLLFNERKYRFEVDGQLTRSDPKSWRTYKYQLILNAWDVKKAWFFTLFLVISPPPNGDTTNVNINITEPWDKFYEDYNGYYHNFTMAEPSTHNSHRSINKDNIKNDLNTTHYVYI